MDVVTFSGGHRSLARPPQLPLHGLLSEALGLAAAERLGLSQLPEGADRHQHAHHLLSSSQHPLVAVMAFQCLHSPLAHLEFDHFVAYIVIYFVRVTVPDRVLQLLHSLWSNFPL